MILHFDIQRMIQDAATQSSINAERLFTMKKYHLLLAALVVACLSQSELQAQLDFEWQPSGTDNYNVGSNWDFFSLQSVPAGSSNQRAIIDNGGTAQVSDTPNSPGAIILGGVVGPGGLDILSGGNLSTDDSGADVDGSITVGNADGDGILTVSPGGTLAPVGALTVGTGAGSSATFGASAGAGTANVTVPSASFAGSLTAFGNSNFMSTGDFTLAATNSYFAEINGTNAPTLQATGAASLGGALTANFAGTPAPGSSWTLVDAGSIAGSFSSFNSNVSLPTGQAFAFSTVAGGNGQQLTLSLDEVLILEVNRNTGIASIKQAAGASGSVSIDGYSILSSEGSLLTGGWDSLANQGALGGGWTESNPSANALNELKAVGSGTLAPGASASVGSVYDPFAVPFGFVGEDLSFEYTTSSGQTLNGVVELTGTLVNNMVLQIDPTTGEARIRNSSGTSVAIDAYTIESASGSLDAANWNSLDDQNAAGGEWLELFNPANDNMVGEVEPGAGTATGPSGEAILEIGQVFDTAGEQDLVFQYKEAGALSASLGTVIYAEIVDVPGDLNFDGSVNGADFLFAQRAADPTAAIATWAANYPGGGALQAATAVPEPGTVSLTMLVLGISALRRGGASRR